MKTSIIKSIGIFAFLAAVVSSCTCPPEYTYIMELPSNQEIAHVYGFTIVELSQNGLENRFEGNAPVNDEVDLLKSTPSIHNGDGFLMITNKITGYEIRYKNGWTNLASFNKDNKSSVKIKVDIPLTVTCDGEVLNGYYYESALDITTVTSPPSYAHLCYPDIDFTSPKGYRYTPDMPARLWQIVELKDDDGVDLIDDNDWKCYSDDQFGFTKTGKVEYYPMNNRCGAESNLTDNVYYFGFDVTADFPQIHSDPGEIKIVIQTGGFEDLGDIEFTVEDSNFDEISGTVAHPETGEIAHFVIQPIE